MFTADVDFDFPPGFRCGVWKLAQLDRWGHDQRGLLQGHPNAIRLCPTDRPLGEHRGGTMPILKGTLAKAKEFET